MFVALMMQLTKYTKQCRGCRIRGNGTGLDGHMVQHGAADVLPPAYLSIAFGLTNTNVQCTHTSLATPSAAVHNFRPFYSRLLLYICSTQQFCRASTRCRRVEPVVHPIYFFRFFHSQCAFAGRLFLPQQNTHDHFDRQRGTRRP